MTIIAVPYHLDEYLPDLDLPAEPDQTVTPAPAESLQRAPYRCPC